MEIALDTNIFYSLIRDCRSAYDQEKCVKNKVAAKKILEYGRIRGCVIPTPVQREAKKEWIKEFAPFCSLKEVSREEKRAIDKFVDKLVTIAARELKESEKLKRLSRIKRVDRKEIEEARKFLNLCTPEKAKNDYERIAKAKEGDWKIVAESMIEKATLVSFDKNIHNEYCKEIYKKVAEEVGIDYDGWDAKNPHEFLEVVGWEE